MTITSLRLIDLYKLEYLNLWNDASVQSVINRIVEQNHKEIKIVNDINIMKTLKDVYRELWL